MKFAWPTLLWLLLVLPLLVMFYMWLLSRRKKFAVQYANLALVRQAVGRVPAWRRHLPPLLFLLALALLLLAAARPSAVVLLPSQHETIIMAMDVSGSMRAKDVEPTRLAASQNAARAFITQLPARTKVGIVSFAGTAALVLPPTASREDAQAAIDRFQLQRGTATGSGIIVSLAALFPDGGYDVGEITYGRDNNAQSASLDAPRDATKKPFTPVAPGADKSAAIILLTDGQRTTGPDPLDAARLAAERGVRVYTVGVGTVEGEVIGFEGWSFRARLDEDTLKAVANLTMGEYFYAGTAVDLRKVYETLNSRLVMERKETEVTALLAAAAAALLVIGAALSLAWFNRVL
jgi:Ca-activated chloride channel homolog